MIILISGSTHTGKTNLSQRLLEKYHYPYLSIDHLKMGLIRSNNTTLTPYDDDELVPYLWNIVREIVKTAIENNQNLIIEGCYIPFSWRNDFDDEYLKHIKYCCLIMTEKYIKTYFKDILKYASVIEKRGDEDLSMESLIAENQKNLSMCRKYGCAYILIDKDYSIDIDIFKTGDYGGN